MPSNASDITRHKRCHLKRLRVIFLQIVQDITQILCIIIIIIMLLLLLLLLLLLSGQATEDTLKGANLCRKTTETESSLWPEGVSGHRTKASEFCSKLNLEDGSSFINIDYNPTLINLFE